LRNPGVEARSRVLLLGTHKFRWRSSHQREGAYSPIYTVQSTEDSIISAVTHPFLAPLGCGMKVGAYRGCRLGTASTPGYLLAPLRGERRGSLPGYRCNQNELLAARWPREMPMRDRFEIWMRVSDSHW